MRQGAKGFARASGCFHSAEIACSKNDVILQVRRQPADQRDRRRGQDRRDANRQQDRPRRAQAPRRRRPTDKRPQLGLYRRGKSRPRQDGMELHAARAAIGVGDKVGAASSARRNASAVPMSGCGAPLRTATPRPVRPRSTREPATSLSCRTRSSAMSGARMATSNGSPASIRRLQLRPRRRDSIAEPPAGHTFKNRGDLAHNATRRSAGEDRRFGGLGGHEPRAESERGKGDGYGDNRGASLRPHHRVPLCTRASRRRCDFRRLWFPNGVRDVRPAPPSRILRHVAPSSQAGTPRACNPGYPDRLLLRAGETRRLARIPMAVIARDLRIPSTSGAQAMVLNGAGFLLADLGESSGSCRHPPLSPERRSSTFSEHRLAVLHHAVARMVDAA